jgi:Zn-dependent peptidase ImmA (M78 family)/transcriptional regulator with XRE-family HTH domain
VTGSDVHGVASVFDPTRLRIARQAAMLRKNELATRIGVSPAAISQYEKGSSSPSPRVVAALALALGVTPTFFGADRPLGAAPATTAHFRSLRSTPQQERDRAFSHALLTWEFAEALQQYVRLPALNLPTDISVDPDDPITLAEQAARLAREAMGLGTGPIPNVVRLLESRGVVCTRLPAKTRRVFAFSCSFPHRPVVVLATERTHLAAGRFDAAHELGHLLMHHDVEPGSRLVEHQANAFASEFLAPAGELRSRLPSTVNWRTLLALKLEWGISIQALLYKSRALGTMSDSSYRRACVRINSLGWRENEPGDDGAAEDPVLLAKAVAALEGTGLDLDALADQVRIPTTLLRQIIIADRPGIEPT